MVRTQESRDRMKRAALKRERQRKRTAERLALYEAAFGRHTLADLRARAER